MSSVRRGSSLSISVAAVSERDIDLLLLEEFVSSPEFASWFVERVASTLTPPFDVLSASRSVTESTGESDLEVFIADGADQTTCLLIENKVSARFQPEQGARYRERGTSYIIAGRCATVVTVLVAPNAYVGASSVQSAGFEAHVTYESISTWFAQQPDLGPRVLYKTALLTAAINKGTVGYQPIEDAPATDFWRSYWLLAKREAPELEMREPGGKPAGSTFVYFKPAALEPDVYIIHKMAYGNVDLQFYRTGSRLQQLRQRFGTQLELDMTIQRAHRSAVIRIKVPKLKLSSPFEAQIDDVRLCLQRATRLLRWYESANRRAV